MGKILSWVLGIAAVILVVGVIMGVVASQATTRAVAELAARPVPSAEDIAAKVSVPSKVTLDEATIAKLKPDMKGVENAIEALPDQIKSSMGITNTNGGIAASVVCTETLKGPGGATQAITTTLDLPSKEDPNWVCSKSGKFEYKPGASQADGGNTNGQGGANTNPGTYEVSGGTSGDGTSTQWVAHKLPLAELDEMVQNTNSDEFADTLVALIGEHCDQGGICPRASDGGWKVNGPAIIMTDPTGEMVVGAEVFKTYEGMHGRYGAYYCASSCQVPTPGRAAILEGHWTGKVEQAAPAATQTLTTSTPAASLTSAPAPTSQVAPKLSITTLNTMIAATKADAEAMSLLMKVAKEYCDNNGQCYGHDTGWTVNGPSLILIDPLGVAIPNARVVKPVGGKNGHFGVYYCEKQCAVASAGREVKLGGPLQ